MRFEVEILDTDINDKNLILEAVKLVSDLTLQISEVGRMSLINELLEVHDAVEQLKHQWYLSQEGKIMNSFKDFLGDEGEARHAYEAV